MLYLKKLSFCSIFFLILFVSCDDNEINIADKIGEDFIYLIENSENVNKIDKIEHFKSTYKHLNYSILILPPYRYENDLDNFNLNLSPADKNKIIEILNCREEICLFILVNNELIFYKYNSDLSKSISTKGNAAILDQANIDKLFDYIEFTK